MAKVPYTRPADTQAMVDRLKANHAKIEGLKTRRASYAKPREVDTSPAAATEQRRMFAGGRKNKQNWPAPEMPT